MKPLIRIFGIIGILLAGRMAFCQSALVFDGKVWTQNNKAITRDVTPWSNTKSSTFNGLDEYVEFGDDPFDFGTNDFTIAGYFRAIAIDGTMLAKGSFGGTGDWVIYDVESIGGPMIFRSDNALGAGNYVDLVNNPAATTNTWYHLAITREGSNITGYVDGVFSDSKGTPFTPNYDFSNNHQMTAGAREDGTSRYLNGFLDELSVWNKALASNEVFEAYNAGVPFNLTSHSASANLVSYWRMGDSPDVAANYVDRVGTNNGTGVNMDASNIVTEVP